MQAHPTCCIASRFAQRIVLHPEIPHAAVRLGLWLAAVADQLGTDSVDMFHTHFIFGYDDGALRLPGFASRPDTVRKSIATLEQQGLLTTEQGALSRASFTSTRFTFTE